jgi:hypothetical protein
MLTSVIGSRTCSTACSTARRTGVRTLGATLGASLISLCALPVAQADIHLAVGSRFEPLRYTTAFFPDASPSTARPPSLYTQQAAPFGSTSLSPYLGLFFAQRYGIMAALDIAYSKLYGETQAMSDAMPNKDGNSYFQFGLSIGFKIYITPPRATKIAPYVYADLFKYFASVSTDNIAITGEQAAAQAAMLSPIGATAAFGAEYFVSPGFSIGSEIFGLRVSNVSGEYHDSAMAMGPQTRHSSNYTQVAFYTGLTFNFRFQVSASVRATDDDKDSDDKARKRNGDYAAPPSPPPTPPPTPEAVD